MWQSTWLNLPRSVCAHSNSRGRLVKSRSCLILIRASLCSIRSNGLTASIRLYSRASLRGARPASKSWPGHCAQLCAGTSANCYARSAAAHPRLAREAFDPVVVDLGFVNAAEWARVVLSADTLLLLPESGALAWGMLERYLKAADCSRPRSQRRSDHHQSLAPESRRTSRKIRKGSQTILLLC